MSILLVSNPHHIQHISQIILQGLFGRGLKTRIFGNALQSILFTIVWRGLAERWSSESKGNASTAADTASLQDESKREKRVKLL